MPSRHQEKCATRFYRRRKRPREETRHSDGGGNSCLLILSCIFKNFNNEHIFNNKCLKKTKNFTRVALSPVDKEDDVLPAQGWGEDPGDLGVSRRPALPEFPGWQGARSTSRTMTPGRMDAPVLAGRLGAGPSGPGLTRAPLSPTVQVHTYEY